MILLIGKLTRLNCGLLQALYTEGKLAAVPLTELKIFDTAPVSQHRDILKMWKDNGWVTMDEIRRLLQVAGGVDDQPKEAPQIHVTTETVDEELGSLYEEEGNEKTESLRNIPKKSKNRISSSRGECL